MIDAGLYEALLERLPEMADEVADRLVAEIPLYDKLAAGSTGAVTVDIRRVAEQNLRFFVRSFRAGRLPEPGELAEIRSAATLRAAKGVPLEAVIAAYHLGARVAWDAVMADKGRQDLAWIVTAQDHLIRYLQAVVPAVAAGYEQRIPAEKEPK
ncbi:hypothetical protein SAMN05216266_1396 [Amycolatopsis marina]|uniref:RsbT co-antagonist protein RsbRD N-terminal domain-containing protein n=1 Tax=Amycolatopsis marina TaxID=490629 RepID=A0A1I1CMR5_9PSEU|nr:hypothetical protein [Amycolatopsis marina]SFB63961.1 hypothetical protein SAMN05216266_1396 [Amycolatopsis marina]